MLVLSVAGPILAILATLDIVSHVYLDLKKTKNAGTRLFRGPTISLPSSVMIAVSISTLISFLIVLLIIIGWIIGSSEVFLWFILLADPPLIVWMLGLLLLVVGISLHGWSRYVRQEMATSWQMSEGHQLITTGPYSRVRHPSYTSYLICFAGLMLMIPSLMTMLLLLGYPGYYFTAITEEKLLLNYFSDEYREYMSYTGRFLPKLKIMSKAL
ncbi:MAG: methyltransferase family protein [Candidatus Hodarchaeota archaeon]